VSRKRGGRAVSGFLLVLVLVLLYASLQLFSYGEPPVDPNWEAKPAAAVPDGAVTVRFSGTTTLLFSDGETTWMTDGWFSRPGLLRILFGKLAPDREAIERGLRSNRVEELAAVFPLHSHFDHAMDAAEVARLTGAMLIGSEATANIGRGGGLGDERIRVVQDGDRVELGQFRITVYESRHMPYPSDWLTRRLIDDREIPRPLVPPASAFDYKVGRAWVLLVEHPAGSFLISGSAGFIPGQLRGIDVDAVFVGVGGLGTQSEEYREDYWRETVTSVKPEQIIPVHWDSLLRPTDLPMAGELRLLGGGDALRDFLLRRQQLDPDIRWWTPPRYDAVLLLAPGE
jgi:L-ascorbate metabolism protein UlaG (beta-lactamase superfamily)